MKYITISFLIVLVMLLSCNDNDIEVYGSKNTVTVNLPDGKHVYPVVHQKDDIVDEWIGYGSYHKMVNIGTEYESSHLLIINAVHGNEMNIRLSESGIPFPLGKRNHSHLQHSFSCCWPIFGIQFRNLGLIYFNHLDDSADFFQIDELQLGSSFTSWQFQGQDPDTYKFNQISILKGKFNLRMSSHLDYPPYSEIEEILITGTIHISQE